MFAVRSTQDLPPSLKLASNTAGIPLDQSTEPLSQATRPYGGLRAGLREGAWAGVEDSSTLPFRGIPL